MKPQTVLLACLAITWLLAGCATTPAPVGDPNLLAFLKDGATRRKETIAILGQPSGRFEADTILTYRLAFTRENNGYLLVEREVTNNGWPLWTQADYSLVLVFDDAGVLTKHSLVKVGKRAPNPKAE